MSKLVYGFRFVGASLEPRGHVVVMADSQEEANALARERILEDTALTGYHSYAIESLNMMSVTNPTVAKILYFEGDY